MKDTRVRENDATAHGCIGRMEAVAPAGMDPSIL
jgi:hypothetical protein